MDSFKKHNNPPSALDADLLDEVKVRVNEARAMAEDLAETAKDKAAQVTGQATNTIDSAMTNTGRQMEHLADTVRQNAPEGKVGDAANTVARALERGGDYLKQADSAAVRSDLESLIRRHPVESLLVGLGVGFLLARATRR